MDLVNKNCGSEKRNCESDGGGGNSFSPHPFFFPPHPSVKNSSQRNFAQNLEYLAILN